MDTTDKEVYFDFYCPRCAFRDVDEAEDPCDTCLEYPSNQNSHKPHEYKPARGHENDLYPDPVLEAAKNQN